MDGQELQKEDNQCIQELNKNSFAECGKKTSQNLQNTIDILIAQYINAFAQLEITESKKKTLNKKFNT